MLAERSIARPAATLLTENLAAQVGDAQAKEPRVLVESEEQPDRLLLETRIYKEDGFQKQGGTLDAAVFVASAILTRVAQKP